MSRALSQEQTCDESEKTQRYYLQCQQGIAMTSLLLAGQRNLSNSAGTNLDYGMSLNEERLNDTGQLSVDKTMLRKVPAWIEGPMNPLIARASQWVRYPFEKPLDTGGFIFCHEDDYLRLSRHPEVKTAREMALIGFRSRSALPIALEDEQCCRLRLKERVAEVARVGGAGNRGD